MKSKRINERTPHGGSYSEIFYFNEDGNPEDEEKAVKCVIRECSKDGNLISETWATCKQ